MELRQALLNIGQDNQIEQCAMIRNNVNMTNRMDHYSNFKLRFTKYCRYNENVQVFLTDSALKSFENSSSQSMQCTKSQMDEIQKLASDYFILHDCENKSPSNDYISWSRSGEDLIEKAKKFREEIDIYNDYSTQRNFISKLLTEIIEYYLNEYLTQQEHFTENETQDIENCFKAAFEEQNYFEYFIKAYTFSNNFHRLLNKHLALYILDYFEQQQYSSWRKNYRLINCLVHIVTLLINDPGIDNYKYKGITYRGLIMNKNELAPYSIGNYILNKSFISTSENLRIAQIFADAVQGNISNKISAHDDQTQVSVIFKFEIKQNATAIDIKHMSMMKDEGEVLILPFSVFKVKNRIDNPPSTSTRPSVEIELEEHEDNEQINSENQKLLKTGDSMGLDFLRKRFICFGHGRNRRKFVFGLVLFIAFCLIAGVSFIATKSIQSKITPLRGTNVVLSIRARWSLTGETVAGGNGEGVKLNQLWSPHGIYVHDDQTVYVADRFNHRIVAWLPGAKEGQLIAGEKGEGSKFSQLSHPVDVIIDRKSSDLLICDANNKRVVRWPHHGGVKGDIVLPEIGCGGLMADDRQFLYVYDRNKHEIRRFQMNNDLQGTLVASEINQGINSNANESFGYLFIDQNHSIYASNNQKHRVMKWMDDALEGLIVAGRNQSGNDAKHLMKPFGVLVDNMGTIYVADSGNNRVMRWPVGASQGSVVVGGNGFGNASNQLSTPVGLSFDRYGNLYVVDKDNHRVQKFKLLSV